jgi:hypothetical protein
MRYWLRQSADPAITFAEGTAPAASYVLPPRARARAAPAAMLRMSCTAGRGLRLDRCRVDASALGAGRSRIGSARRHHRSRRAGGHCARAGWVKVRGGALFAPRGATRHRRAWGKSAVACTLPPTTAASADGHSSEPFGMRMVIGARQPALDHSWVGRGPASPGADVARGEPGPGADVARVSPVPAQMWRG